MVLPRGQEWFLTSPVSTNDYKNKYYLVGAIVWMAVHVVTEIISWGRFLVCFRSMAYYRRGFHETHVQMADRFETPCILRCEWYVASDLYGYMGLTSLSGGYMENPALIQSQIENRDLEWETNYNLNIGLDFGFFNRLNFTLEYYTRTTKNLLNTCPVSILKFPGILPFLTLNEIFR